MMVYFDAGNVAIGDVGSAMHGILCFGTPVQADGQPKPNIENQGIQRQLHMGSSSLVVIRLHSASHGPCICWPWPLHLIVKFCKTMKWPDDIEHLHYNSAESLLLQFCYVA